MIAAIYYLLFGLFSAGLGIAAWQQVRSKPSLIAGVASGILLILAWVLILIGHHSAGNVLGIVICVLLAARFVPAYIRKRALYPDGLMAALSVLGAALGVAFQT
ncbi:MAG: TMEM14 family protein [Verrucomicrobiales bacterium]